MSRKKKDTKNVKTPEAENSDNVQPPLPETTPPEATPADELPQEEDTLTEDLEQAETLSGEAPEEAPAAEPEQPKVEAVKSTTPKKPERDHVAHITNMLNEYATLATMPAITLQTQSKIIVLFSNIIAYAVANPTEELLTEVYNFFVKHRKSLLSESTVFGGIDSLAKGTRERMQVFYAAFCMCIDSRKTGKPAMINMDLVREILGKQEIVSFIAAKTNR